MEFQQRPVGQEPEFGCGTQRFEGRPALLSSRIGSGAAGEQCRGGSRDKKMMDFHSVVFLAFGLEKMLAEHYYNKHWGGFQCKRGTVFFVLY